MSQLYYRDAVVTLWHGDALDVLRELPDGSADAVITDPPYNLSFMGREWDSHTTPLAFQEWCTEWATECLRILKPGGHLLSFGGSRTWHRLAAAVEDAGFEIRDSIAWLYGSGFPKSHDVSKAIDKAAEAERQVIGPNLTRHGGGTGTLHGGGIGAEVGTITTPATDAARQWQGWGTALKPGFEPIVVGRKPLAGTVAANVLEHGTGALNIDACRIEGIPDNARANKGGYLGYHGGDRPDKPYTGEAGRWPTNVVLDDATAAELDEQTAGTRASKPSKTGSSGTARGDVYGGLPREYDVISRDDVGGASRFFPVFRYEAKADAAERPRVNGISHATVKPLALMRWLVRLVTQPGGTVLDPFAGSGTTVEACLIEGFQCIAIEREADYLPLIEARIARRTNATRALELAGEDMGLLGLLDDEDGDAA